MHIGVKAHGMKHDLYSTHFGTGHPDPGHGVAPRPESASKAQCEALEEIEQIRRSAKPLHESEHSS